MDLSDSDIGLINIVTWDMAMSEIQQGTRGMLSNGDMRHCHILNSTCNIRTPVKGLICGEGQNNNTHDRPIMFNVFHGEIPISCCLFQGSFIQQ